MGGWELFEKWGKEPDLPRRPRRRRTDLYLLALMLILLLIVNYVNGNPDAWAAVLRWFGG